MPVRREPDFENLLKVLKRQKPARPTLFEFYTNERVNGILAPQARDWPKTKRFGTDALAITAYRNAGYDYATLHASDFHFPTGEFSIVKPSPSMKADLSATGTPSRRIHGLTP